MATATSPRFPPVERRTLSEEIRLALLGAIRTGTLAPGSSLPSERELAEQFNVARTSVREAMQGLISLGVVERRGNRSLVTEHLPDLSLYEEDHRKSRVLELFEVRKIIEVPLAELVSKRATDADLALIRGIADRFSEDMEIAEFRQLDREFHTALAAACSNRLLAEVYGKVLDSLFRSADFEEMLTAQANRVAVRRIVASSTNAHRAIANAVCLGDPEQAKDAVHAHLDQVESEMLSRMA
jgi:GntR family transcriptional regulator, transcriptional repressor for pyruvate dehydrogenase complex